MAKTKPNGWKKQINPNTKRMAAMMKSIRADVERRTRNSKTIDEWQEKLAPYIASNVFNTGIYATEALDIVKQIVGTAEQTSLPSGSTMEMMKGTMTEACYTMVTNVGEDIKEALRGIAIQGYDNQLTPHEIALEMGKAIESFSSTRCETIARTETARAANISEYLSQKEAGALSYRVICNEGCCPYCQEAYGNEETGGVGTEVFPIDEIDNLPPYHPNCRCTPVYSMYDENGELPNQGESENTEENTTTGTNYLINTNQSNTDIKITPEQFQNVINHQNKRESSKIEWGNAIDNVTGKLIHDKDIRGKKNKVFIPTHNRPYSIIHNHTSNNGFSGGDAYSHLTNNNQEICYATTPEGIWIMRDTKFATFNKNDFGIPDSYANEIKSKMTSKYKEIVNAIKPVYTDLLNNAKSKSEKEEIRQLVNSKVASKYNEWLLNEYGVGKKKDALIEIEFISKKRLKNVKF